MKTNAPERDKMSHTPMQQSDPEQQMLSRFEEALVFAAQKHKAQTRKGTSIPYIAHLMQVSGIALENGADEDEAIAALLHDVMEDQDVTQEELTRRFGPAVAAIVVGCSDSASTNKPEWKQRKDVYISHILTASKSIRLVSSCDKLHNARAILADYQELGDDLWSRFTVGQGDILWYYRSLVDKFQEAQAQQGEPPSRVVAELARVVGDLERQMQARK